MSSNDDRVTWTDLDRLRAALGRPLRVDCRSRMTGFGNGKIGQNPPYEARANRGRCSTMSARSSAAPAAVAARSHVVAKRGTHAPIVDGLVDR